MDRVKQKRWPSLLVCAALAAVTLAVYWPVLHNGFVVYDDPDYVTDNPQVAGGLSWANAGWAFGTGHASNWHPLTWLSHELDGQLYGLKPAGHHLSSLLLHIANTLLLFLVLKCGVEGMRSAECGVRSGEASVAGSQAPGSGATDYGPRTTDHGPGPARKSAIVNRKWGSGVWLCAFVAALFALHPLHVESVAWVAERKDVLSGFFFLLTLWAYVQYVKAKGSAECGVRSAESGGHVSRFTLHVSRFYLLSLCFFALGLMSKPMLVTVPFVLLLLDYWPLGRMQNGEQARAANAGGPETAPPASRFTFHVSRTARKSYIVNRILLEKLPFFALSLASCVVTLWAQHAGGAVASLERLSAGSRAANALASACAYLGQTVWPRGLAVFYPYSPVPAWQVWGAALVLTCLTLLCLWQVRARPWLLVGWAWFGVMLLPVIGLVQVGSQARADRYTYLPSIGLFIAVAWGLGRSNGQTQRSEAATDLREAFGVRGACSRFGTPPDLTTAPASWTHSKRFAGQRARRAVVSVLGVVVLLACAACTQDQLRPWQDSMRLFRHALAVTTDNWLAHHNVGTVLAEEGRTGEAAEQFRAALRINPGCDQARNNLARLLFEQGKPAEAKAQLEVLLRRNPSHAAAHRNLGRMLVAEGHVAEGVAQYALARQLQPEDMTTAEDLAAALAQPAAAPLEPPELDQALDLLPTAEMRARLAGTWAGQGKFQAALQGYRAALALQPQSPDILNNLAWLRATCPEAWVRDGAEAVRLGELACQLTGGKRTLMVGTLAAAYAEAGRFAEAAATAERARAQAAAAGDKALAGRNEELLELYRAGRAYHEPATEPGRE